MRTFKYNDWLYANYTDQELKDVLKGNHLQYHKTLCREELVKRGYTEYDYNEYRENQAED